MIPLVGTAKELAMLRELTERDDRQGRTRSKKFTGKLDILDRHDDRDSRGPR